MGMEQASTINMNNRLRTFFVLVVLQFGAAQGSLRIVTKGTLLTTLPRLGKNYDVSFDMWVQSFSGPNRRGWMEVLRFTSTGNNCCNPGDRIPAVFVNKGGYIHVTSQVGSNNNYYSNIYIRAQTWVKVEVKQYCTSYECNSAWYVVRVD